ncbi:MAG: YARHG domain-containing protein [Deltaproteobacteria bacterium]|nr:YARHG domain-containing protein [Deltaproteobacteria bacterium]
MKKIKYLFIILALFLCVNLTYGSEDKNEIHRYSTLEKNNDQAARIINGEINLLKYTIDYLSIAVLDKTSMRILRNCIFARYGYKFKEGDLFQYFNKFDWYKPLYDNVDDRLTKIDKFNVKRILAFERIDKTQKKILNPIDLVGVWQDTPIMPAGWSRRFIFYPDKKFRFIYSQMRELPEILSLFGNYEIKGNCLEINITEKVIIEHSDKSVYSSMDGFQWTDQSYKKIVLKNSEKFNFPITSVRKKVFTAKMLGGEKKLEREVINIGYEEYFRYYADPERGYEPGEIQ